MDALQSVPACAGAGGFLRLMIFARRRARACAIRLADIFTSRRILRDVIARLLARIGGDRVELIRLLGIDLLRRTLRAAAAEQGQCDDGPCGQYDPHTALNARAELWGTA